MAGSEEYDARQATIAKAVRKAEEGRRSRHLRGLGEESIDRLPPGKHGRGDRTGAGDMVHRRLIGTIAVTAPDGIDDAGHLRRPLDIAILRLDRHGAQVIDAHRQ